MLELLWRLTLLIQWALSSGRPVRSPLRHCKLRECIKLGRGRKFAKPHFSNGDLRFLGTARFIHVQWCTHEPELMVFTRKRSSISAMHAHYSIRILVHGIIIMVHYNLTKLGTGRFQEENGRTQVKSAANRALTIWQRVRRGAKTSARPTERAM